MTSTAIGTKPVTLTQRMQAMLEFSIDPAAGWRSVERDGEVLAFSGGYLAEYDGKAVSEAGFLVYPDAPAVSNGGTGSAKTANGTYTVMAVYVRVNGAGQEVRSQASLPTTYTLTSSNTKLAVSVSTCRIGSATDATKIEIYCTLNGQTTLYLEQVAANDPTVDTISVTLSVADATLAGAPTIYTTGGISDDVQLDAPLMLAESPTRFFTVSGSEPTAAQPSKEILHGVDVSFYADASEPIHQGEGEILGLGYLASRLFAWKDRSMFVASGDGPDLTGGNDTLSVFEEFAPDVGLMDIASLVVTAVGIVFRSSKGFYLLSRDGGLTYIGADVEDTVSANIIVDSAYSEDAREVRFLLSGGTSALVLTIFETKDQGVQWKWSTDSYATIINAIVSVAGEFRCTYTLNGVESFARMIFSSADGATEFGASLSTIIKLGFVSMAGIQAFQRIYKALILANKLGSNNDGLNVTVNYDGDTTGEGHNIRTAQFNGGSARIEVRTNRQKCESIQLILTETFNASLSFVGIALQVGVKGKPNRPSAQRM